MARHAAELPTRRRVIAAGLGATTVLLLAVALWQLGGASAGVRAEAPTTTSMVPTTVPSTTPTSITATAPPTTRTTTPPTTRTTVPPTTETTTTTLAPLVLGPDGLGPVSLGATPEEAIATVSERLGGASSDSGWVNAQGTFGTCPGNIVRVVRWQSLRLFFSDGPTAFGEDAGHLFYYSQSSVQTEVVVALTTDAGIGIGSTVEELTAAYGDRLTIESTSPFGVTFTIESARPGLLSGTLSQSIPEGQVTSVSGGFGCGG